MKKYLLTLVSLLLMSAATWGASHYSLYKFSGNVTVESGGRSVKASEGMTLNPNDNIVIPKGGSAEVYNGLDKNIYRSATPGRTSVTRLMINASKTAAEKFGSVGTKMRIARTGKAGKERVFVEKGMVKRSLAVFDPGACDAEMDTESVAMRLASMLASQGRDSLPQGITVDLAFGASPQSVSVGVANNLEVPVYYNLLSYKAGEGVEISPLGQPEGCFVLLPGQETIRSQKSSLPTGTSTILIATPVKFNLDKVTERANALLRSASSPKPVLTDLPIIIRPYRNESPNIDCTFR